MSYPYGRVIQVSKIFQKGKTQIPDEVRTLLKVVDGDKIVWIESADGKILVEGSKRRGRYEPT